MSLLTILSPTEQSSFDSPPTFTSEERITQFATTNTELTFIQSLKTPTNRAGFLLQFGYFKVSGKFFTAEKFRQKDIAYVANLLNVKLSHLKFTRYQKKTGITHRKKILNMLCWQPLTKPHLKLFNQHIERLAQKQLPPKHIFSNAINYCWEHKLEIPSVYTLTTLITCAYNLFEETLLSILQNKMTEAQQKSLTMFAEGNPSENLHPLLLRPPITQLKKINQSLRPGDIEDNIKAFITFRDYFLEFKCLIDELNLSDAATRYLATWVKKAKTFQINQFPNKMKSFLYLIGYIKHQFYLRHDTLVDIFLKSVHTANNTARKKELELDQQQKPAQQKAFKTITLAGKSSRALINKMRITLKSTTLLESDKLATIETLLNEYDIQHDKNSVDNVIKLEDSLESTKDNRVYFDSLEALSLKLQHRVTQIVAALDFNPGTSDESIMKAIDHFKITKSQIGNNPPQLFLKSEENSVIHNNGKLRTSLYKILLFICMKDAVKAGKLNLYHSYRYKSIKEYLIDDLTWENNRDNLLVEANLADMANLDVLLEKLTSQLDHKYETLNQNYLQGNNKYLTIKADNRVKVKTPKLDEHDNDYIASLLIPQGYVPVLRVLNEINQLTQFTHHFKHFSIKHKKMKPLPRAILACIIGQGCNIGINRLANISVGVSEDSLKNTINWFFTLENIQTANDTIIRLIDKLSLANAFRAISGELHTGSDGRKINVAVDSLHASYSFKYYGKGKGVTLYVFLDERQALFYSTVITSSDRDAPYVIDGLLNNNIVKSSIHSTDTHGFTEAIFAVADFMGTAFAPRIKKIGKQKLYTLGSINDYKNKGYKILPSRTINQQLIRDHWNDLLRFMVSIKLKHATASQLFKRLSSYAKDHPLYQAIKEFGRIMKSIFILTYLDDVELRQRIQKQLNKVELSNKFSKAVFFANNQEFKCGTQEEQEIAAACSVLIQNAIVLWNYLTVSQCLASIKDIIERDKMVAMIKQGSMMTWGHLNMGGEYDFTLPANEDEPFDIEKILELKLKAA